MNTNIRTISTRATVAALIAAMAVTGCGCSKDNTQKNNVQNNSQASADAGKTEGISSTEKDLKKMIKEDNGQTDKQNRSNRTKPGKVKDGSKDNNKQKDKKKGLAVITASLIGKDGKETKLTDYFYFYIGKTKKIKVTYIYWPGKNEKFNEDKIDLYQISADNTEQTGKKICSLTKTNEASEKDSEYKFTGTFKAPKTEHIGEVFLYSLKDNENNILGNIAFVSTITKEQKEKDIKSLKEELKKRYGNRSITDKERIEIEKDSEKWLKKGIVKEVYYGEKIGNRYIKITFIDESTYKIKIRDGSKRY